MSGLDLIPRIGAATAPEPSVETSQAPQEGPSRGQLPASLAMSVALISTVLLGVAWTSEQTGDGSPGSAATAPPAFGPGADATASGDGGGAPTADAPGLISVSRYQVRSDDTLSGIAAMHAIELSELVAHNGIDEPHTLMPGDRLDIPFPRDHRAGAPDPTGPEAAEVRQSIHRWSDAYGLSPHLMSALSWVESRWRQDARSEAGAVGVGQLLPNTATWVATELIGEPVDLYRTDDNVRLSARLLHWLIDHFDGDEAAALAAYYQGTAALDRWGWYTDTEAYVAEIFGLRWEFRSAA